jgi:hypothetical protein
MEKRKESKEYVRNKCLVYWGRGENIIWDGSGGGGRIEYGF